MTRRFPKYGFRAGRFNNNEVLEQLNLGKLAYHIEKGHLDTSKLITMKDLVQQGVITRVQHGVKILAKGAENFKQTGAKVDLEVTDASDTALKIIKEMGGSVKVEYRTPLLLR